MRIVRACGEITELIFTCTPNCLAFALVAAGSPPPRRHRPPEPETEDEPPPPAIAPAAIRLLLPAGK